MSNKNKTLYCEKLSIKGHNSTPVKIESEDSTLELAGTINITDSGNGSPAGLSVNGLDIIDYVKGPLTLARVGSVSNHDIATLDETSTMDNITLALGDVVLLKNQTVPTQNGVYKINSTGSPATRIEHFDTGDVAGGKHVHIQEGSTHSNSTFVCTDTYDDSITDTHDLTWVNATEKSSWKSPVLIASTGSNLTLSGYQTIDGHTLSGIDSILVKDQSDKKKNGVYLSSSGSWSRNAAWGTGSKIHNWSLWVEKGNSNKDTAWVVTNDTGNDTLGTHLIDFAEFTKAAGGSDTHIQFNSAGVTTGSSDLIWDGTTLVTTGGISYGGFELPDSEHVINQLSTGLHKGGLLSVGTGATFDITAGNGLIVDSHTDPNNPTHTDVSWGAINTTVTTLGNLFTHVYITTAGTVLQSIVEPTTTLRRDDIYIGKVFHSDGVSVNSVSNQPDVGIDSNGQSHDFWRGIGPVILSGNRITANGSNLSIDKSAGDFHQSGVGFSVLKESPNVINIPLNTTINFGLADRNSIISLSTLIVPGSYDNAGTVQAIPGSANRATNQRVYLFNSGFVSVQYGQQYYSSMAAAKEALSTETFVVEGNAVANGILIAIISVRSGATDLSLASDAAIFNASKFGEISIGAAGSQTTDLQNAYDNSTTPEIIVDSTRGALTVIDNGTPIGAALFEVQDNSPANVFCVDVNGVKFNDLTAHAVTDSVALFDTTTSGNITMGAALTSGDITLGNSSQSGIVNITNTTNATTISSASLVVDGGLALVKDLYMSGDIILNTFTASITSTNATGDFVISSTASNDVKLRTISSQTLRLGDTTTTGAISMGEALTSGDITLGNSSQTGNVDIASSLTLSGKGTVTQITSQTTGVTLNKSAGIITTFSMTGSAHEFTVTNSKCAADSLVIVSSLDYAGAGDPVLRTKSIASGSFIVKIINLSGPSSFDDVMEIGFIIV